MTAIAGNWGLFLIAGLVLFAVAALWSAWAGRLLQTEEGRRDGTPVAPVSAAPPSPIRGGLEVALPVAPPRPAAPPAQAPRGLGGLESAGPPPSFAPPAAPAPSAAAPPSFGGLESAAPFPATPSPTTMLPALPPAAPAPGPFPAPIAPSGPPAAAVPAPTTAICPRCGYEQPPGRRYCAQCGADMRGPVAATPPLLPPLPRITPPPAPAAATARVAIDREVRVAYTRRMYINRTCEVDLRIGPQARNLDPLTRQEQQTLAEQPAGRLRFQATEDAPLVGVTLSFAEGAFNAHKTVDRRPLQRDAETRFHFALQPLRAEDSVILLEIAYLQPAPGVERVVRKIVIDRTRTSGAGQEIAEHIERQIIAPGQPGHDPIPVQTLALQVQVRSFLWFNAAELNFARAGLAVLFTVGQLGLGVAFTLATGNTSGGGDSSPLPMLLWAASTVLPLLGVPVGDLLKNLGAKPPGGAAS